jgi:molybdopterin/thiamine biosynthesis adenylyltransferase
MSESDLTEEQKTTLNRQIYAFGYEAQAKISKANVLLIGLKGLGIEIGAVFVFIFSIIVVFCYS